MRTALSILMLFAVAVALALLAGNNQGTVTLFWSPHRVDLSLNLVLLLLLIAFGLMHLALRALQGLFSIPQSARRWRQHQRERLMFLALVDALSHRMAGRFVRARKAAELALVHESKLVESGDTEKTQTLGRLRTVAHLLAADGAHALQDRPARQLHWQQAKNQATGRALQEEHEGVQLRAARWALDDHDAGESLRLLGELPQGVARRTIALRLRLKAARQVGQTALALETARLLVKHRAFSTHAGASILQGLALQLLNTAHDKAQLQAAWTSLDHHEQGNAEVALAAAQKWLALGGDGASSRVWLLPLWQQMQGQALSSVVGNVNALSPLQKTALVGVLAEGFAHDADRPDKDWLARVEAAQMARPGDPLLLYLAGMACMQLKLWGKAQQMLRQSASQLRNTLLERKLWLALAQLAQQRGDADALTEAYQKALGISLPDTQSV